MVDFARAVYEDFVRGDLIFVGYRGDATAIKETMSALHGAPCQLSFKTHVINPDYIFIAHHEAHPDWYGEDMSRNELGDKIVIPWETVTQMVDSLSNDSVEDIIARFINAQAYININPLNCDVDDALSLLSREITSSDVEAGYDYDHERHYTPYEYFRYLEQDCYRNIFVDPSMDRAELNASNGFGIGTESSTICPSLVYPISYIAKKMTHGEPLYTEEDFNEIFD